MFFLRPLCDVENHSTARDRHTHENMKKYVAADGSVRTPVARSCGEWYQRCVAHWSAMEDKDHDGVLGGYGAIDAEDAAGSLKFIDEPRARRASRRLGGRARLWRGRRTRDRATCCSTTRRNVASRSRLDCSTRLANSPRCRRMPEGLNSPRSRCEFAPPPGAYDLVWAQWVLGHLTDHDVVQLLTRCTAALRPGGAVCVKDNTCTPSRPTARGGRKYHIDRQNAGVVRTHVHLRSLFRMAGARSTRVRAV